MHGVDHAQLACLNDDPELWFAESPVQLAKAKQLCFSCPARQECLTGALRRGEQWGVWGGEIFHRGVVVPTKRGRGRPPKNQRAA